jgi:hypothetical protein
MTANDFLLIQISITIAGLYLFRHLLRKRWRVLLRVLFFVAAISFSFDYIANDRGIWKFSGEWGLQILINPFENSIFATTMSALLLLLYLGWENRAHSK